ncbi:restriction endonuclease subunit S [Stutzerimonas chloritidismutans]|uniref:restriction endonuclease subunit S n=1 Tax=Stutzerimonas chloritidismutans TaxID=203192 RepID=UPI00384E8DE4
MSSEWICAPLEQCLDALIDYRGKTPVKTSSGIPLITAKVIKGGRIETPTEFIALDNYDSWMRRGIPMEGDVVLTVEAPLGEVAQLGPEKVALAQRVVTLRGKKGLLDNTYLLYLLQTEEMLDQLKTRATGTTVVGIKQSELRKVQLSLPPVDQQVAAARILKALDDRITLLRETNATLEAIAQALFKSWFVDFDPVCAKAEGRQPEGVDATTAALFPDSFEESELGLVPKGWRAGMLSDLASFQNGYAFKSQDWTDTGHPVVKIGDVKPGLIDFSGCSRVDPATVIGLERFKLSRGDVLVGMTGYVGETGLVPRIEPDAYINQRVGRLVTRAGLSDIGMVYCAVRDPAYKAYAEAQSHGSAQANVSGAALLAYPLVIPSPDLLCIFNRIAETLLESVLSNHEQAQILTQLRDTLLPRLISGQLRLPEAEALLEGSL